jgi:hypothetical protein
MTDNAAPLKVGGIFLESIGVFESLEIRPGDITIVSGDNGLGKSTITSAMKAVFDGGNPVNVIRDGEEVGRIAIELSDGVRLEKTLKRNGKPDLKVRHPEYGNISQAKAAIDRMIDRSIDPRKLLDCEAKERVQYFQSKLPLELPKDKIADILQGVDGVGFDPDAHALTVVAAIRKTLEERRKFKRQLRDDKRGSIAELKATLPPEGQKEPTDELSETREMLEVKSQEFTGKEQKIRDDYRVLRNQHKKLFDTFVSDGERLLNEEIEKLRLKWSTEKEARQVEYSAAVENAFTEEGDKMEELRANLVPELEELKSAIARLEERVAQDARTQMQREMLAKAEEEEERLSGEWEKLDSKVKKLDLLKESLVASSPIPGLTIDGDDLAYNGMTWGKLNTATQIMLLFRIAEYCAGPLGFIFFDGLEHLSAASLEIFREEAKSSGRQVFVTIVRDEPLTVRSFHNDGTETVQVIHGTHPEPPTQVD